VFNIHYSLPQLLSSVLNIQHSHPAPWGPALTLISLASTLLLLSVAALTYLVVPTWGALIAASILAIPIGSALFTVRAYRIEGSSLLIKRLFWSTRISLAHLVSATPDPDAMKSSIRLFGNGGLYSFTGLYRNKTLGNYRAFVTDPKRAVILRFQHTKPILVSPTDPQTFADSLSPP
jgi:hypothetical protein